MVNFKIAAIALLLMTSGAGAQQYQYPPYGFGYRGFGYQGFGYQGYGPVILPQQFPQQFDKDYEFYSRITSSTTTIAGVQTADDLAAVAA